MSVLGVVCIIIKYRMEATWRHFNNPMRFYRRIMRSQVDMGLVDKKMMNLKLIHRENPFCWMMKQPRFWLEIVIMMLIPLPIQGDFFDLKISTMRVVNWFDPSGDFPTGSHHYHTPYLTNDFFLAAMFLRFYFVLQTMIAMSPPNNRLNGKRICVE